MGRTKHPRIIFSIEPTKRIKKKYKSASRYRRKMLNALNLAKQQKIKVVSDHKNSKLDFKEYAISIVGKDKVVWLDYSGDGKSTIEMMDNGTPVIFNPRLINRSEGISDTGDVLVRTDVIGRLLPSYEYQDGLDSLFSRTLALHLVSLILSSEASSVTLPIFVFSLSTP